MNMWLTYNGCVKSTDYANRYNGGPHRKSCHCDKQETKTQELINIHVRKHMNLHGSAKLHVHVLATMYTYLQPKLCTIPNQKG